VFAAADRDVAPAGADDLVSYLAWHGITARGCRFAAGAPSVGNALLREADRLGARLLVMGGYSHSRLREFVLGGVTRYVLENAALPILIAH
jgi:nucleotide-binding universal stress UspA family protein